MSATPPPLPPHDNDLTAPLEELAAVNNPAPNPAPAPAKKLTRAEVKARTREINAAYAAKKQAEKDAKNAPKLAKKEAKLAKERARAQEDLETVDRGESIIKGFCPDCGEVSVKFRKGGYNPSILMILIHTILTVTTGVWAFIWGGVALSAIMGKAGQSRTCMKCGKILEQS